VESFCPFIYRSAAMALSKEFNDEWYSLTREDVEDMTKIEIASHFWEAALKLAEGQKPSTNNAMVQCKSWQNSRRNQFCPIGIQCGVVPCEINTAPVA